MADDGGMTGYDPTDPDQVGQPYKTPAASLFDQLGILSPSQKQQMAYQNQQAMISRQLQQQQMILQMKQEQANLGVNSASLGSGFAYPTLLAQNAGGALAGAVSKATKGGWNFQGLFGGNSPAGQGAPTPGTGMSGMTPPPASSIDPSLLIQQAVSRAPTPGQGYASAAEQIGQLAQAKGDTGLAQLSVKLRQMASDQMAKEALAQANVREKAASSGKAEEETALDKARAGNPGTPKDINLPSGETATVRDQFNPDGSFKGTQVGNVGQHAQYTMGELPGDSSKEVKDFGQSVDSAVQLHNSIGTVIDNLQTGAKQGWTADAVGKVNNVLGTLRQIAPISVPDNLKAALDSHSGDFANIAAKTHINESYLSDMTMQLAKTYSSGGRTSNQDIHRAAKVLGEEIGDPRTFAEVLKSVDGRVDSQLSTQRDTLNLRLPAKSQAIINKTYQYYRSRTGKSDDDIPADAIDDTDKYSKSDDNLPAVHPAPIQAILSKYPPK